MRNQQPKPEAANLIEELNKVALKGWPALREAWAKLSQEDRARVGSAFRGIKAKAEDVTAEGEGNE